MLSSGDAEGPRSCAGLTFDGQIKQNWHRRVVIIVKSSGHDCRRSPCCGVAVRVPAPVPPPRAGLVVGPADGSRERLLRSTLRGARLGTGGQAGRRPGLRTAPLPARDYQVYTHRAGPMSLPNLIDCSKEELGHSIWGYGCRFKLRSVNSKCC